MQIPWPVCVGEFFNAVTGEFDAPVPGTVELEEVEDVEDEPEVPLDEEVSRPLKPGDCPGVMYGDCGVLVR